MTSMGRLALVALGILAYKNRDKLADMASNLGRDPNDPNSRGGLQELLDRLRNAGQAETVESWVGSGPNKPIEKSRVEQAIDEETLESLVRQTGMPRDEILERLARNLPDAVNEWTPEGRVPDAPATSQDSLLDPVDPIRPSKL